jgi:hypothetical protein
MTTLFSRRAARRFLTLAGLLLATAAYMPHSQADADDPPPPTPAIFMDAYPANDGTALVVSIAWSSEVALPDSAELIVSNNDGTTAASIDVTPAAGEITDVLLPFDVAAVPDNGFRYRARIQAEGATLGSHGIVFNLDCQLGDDDAAYPICSLVSALDATVTNAVDVSPELDAAVDKAAKQYPNVGLADAVRQIAPELYGEALRYGQDLFALGAGGDDCFCHWAQNGVSGYKLPAYPVSLASNPTGQTWTYGAQGAGAVLSGATRHKGQWWTGNRYISIGNVNGETERTLRLDCRQIIGYQTVEICIDVDGDGLCDFIITFQIPILGGPCEDPTCDSTVDALGLGVTTAYALSDRFGTSFSEGRGTSNLTYKMNASQYFSLASTAHAVYDSIVSPPAQVGIQQHWNLSEPVTLEFHGTVFAESRGRARDEGIGRGTTSYGYALYGYAACADGPDQAISFEAQSYSGWIPHLCSNINTFYAMHGGSVSCP